MALLALNTFRIISLFPLRTALAMRSQKPRAWFSLPSFFGPPDEGFELARLEQDPTVVEGVR